MAEILKLPEIPAHEKIMRQPMTLLDHAKGAGLLQPIIVATNERGELFFQCDNTLTVDNVIYQMERVKLLMFGVLK